MSAVLRLDPDPRAVREARAWVAAELRSRGRPELADSAALGVSELVTNALLHADPPIVVRLRGTTEHPRVEVHDSSLRRPEVTGSLTAQDRLLRTVGRGLGIVALYSTSWGADLSDEGKVVWFEPAAEPSDDPDRGLAGDVFDLDQAVAERLPAAPPEQLLTVRLLGMPARLFGEFRAWYADLRRELRLLALTHPGEYPVAAELAELVLQVEAERRLSRGVERLDEAIAAGLDSVDLEYVVPASAPTTMARAAALLDRLDDFSREHRLLTPEAGPALVALRTWYTGEFTRQARGLPPRPWPGVR